MQLYVFVALHTEMWQQRTIFPTQIHSLALHALPLHIFHHFPLT